MTPVIALLLKAPIVGAVKTRLAAAVGPVAATRVYTQLAEKQVRALPAAWPATVHYDPSGSGAAMLRWLGPLRTELGFIPQCAGDLGQRLAAAFAAEFARGAAAVIAAGGDCPGLDEAVLLAARQALAQSDVVLGPATDGGYYLIGLKRPCPGLFRNIAWSTPAVLAQTREKIRVAALTSSELPPLDDVDDEAGWQRAVAAGLLRR